VYILLFGLTDFSERCGVFFARVPSRLLCSTHNRKTRATASGNAQSDIALLCIIIIINCSRFLWRRRNGRVWKLFALAGRDLYCVRVWVTKSQCFDDCSVYRIIYALIAHHYVYRDIIIIIIIITLRRRNKRKLLNVVRLDDGSVPEREVLARLYILVPPLVYCTPANIIH